MQVPAEEKNKHDWDTINQQTQLKSEQIATEVVPLIQYKDHVEIQKPEAEMKQEQEESNEVKDEPVVKITEN